MLSLVVALQLLIVISISQICLLCCVGVLWPVGQSVITRQTGKQTINKTHIYTQSAGPKQCTEGSAGPVCLCVCRIGSKCGAKRALSR